jgi:hypothetical protein
MRGAVPRVDAPQGPGPCNSITPRPIFFKFWSFLDNGQDKHEEAFTNDKDMSSL